MTEPRTFRNTVTAGTAVTVVCSLPVFLSGALAVQLRESLDFSVAGLGTAVAAFRLSAALLTPYMGKLVDRIGAARAIHLATVTVVASVCGIGLLARGWWGLVLWLVVGGIGRAIGSPAANRLLVRNVRAGRQGFAFGIKQSAPPLASMLAGSVLPLAVTIGWRPLYVVVGLLAGAVGLSVRGSRGTKSTMRSAASPQVVRDRSPLAGGQPADRSLLRLVTLAFALASVAHSPLAVFFVDAATASGRTPAVAGVLLACGSVMAIGARFVGGIVSDRLAGGHLRVSSLQIGIGALGLLLLSYGGPWAMTAGLLAAMVGVWGFQAMFWYAALNMYPQTPGLVTGRISRGGLIGSTVSPVVFGLVVDQLSYRTAWFAAAIVALGSAVVMRASSSRLAQHARRGVV